MAENEDEIVRLANAVSVSCWHLHRPTELTILVWCN